MNRSARDPAQTLRQGSRAFRAEREDDWRRLDGLVARMEKTASRPLSDEELIALPRLYRQALSSLSVARATALDQGLIAYLESLSARAYFVVYGARTSLLQKLGRFFGRDWPAAVRGLGRETIASAALMLLGAVVGFWLCSQDADWYSAFVDPALAAGRDPSATTESLRKSLYGGPRGSPLGILSAYLFTHNAQISLAAFALGFAFCAPTAMLVAFNGAMMGAFFQLYGAHGLAFGLGGWLMVHGVTELFAVTLAGAAGFSLGLALIFPGELSRPEALKRAGRRAATVMAGVCVMLMVAGLLEGFVRQLVTDDLARYAIAGFSALAWGLYFYGPRRLRRGPR